VRSCPALRKKSNPYSTLSIGRTDRTGQDRTGSTDSTDSAVVQTFNSTDSNSTDSKYSTDGTADGTGTRRIGRADRLSKDRY
jgi:hypothetical protein